MKDLSLFLLDIVQNSVRADATKIRIQLKESIKKSTLFFLVEDNGAGMEKSVLSQALDPFFTSRTSRSVGLGLSFLKQLTEATEGTFQLKSKPDQGTCVEALFHTDHIDMVPMGDLSATFMSLLAARSDYHLEIECLSDDASFLFNTETIEDIIQERLDLSEPELYSWCSATIRKGVSEVFNNHNSFKADLSSF